MKPAPATTRGPASAELPWPDARVAWYAVMVLVIAYIFSFIDRIILALLVEPIRNDLGASDFAIGLLQGLAFTIFYATVGVPIGRLADRYSRRRIIGIGIFLWSLATASCGLARNVWQLFLARIGVGVGEATLSPAAYSMIADLFPAHKLGRALGVYQAGAFIGAGISFLIGGAVIHWVMNAGSLALPLLGTVQPWQMVFFIVGLPGLLVALLMWTVREPRRRGQLAGHGQAIAFGVMARYVYAQRRVLLTLFVGFALLAVPITTILTWMPTYYTRILGFSLAEAAVALGSILVVLSPAGVYLGGWLIDVLQRRGYSDAAFRVGIGAAIVLLPLSVIATTVDERTAALWLFGPFVFVASIPMALAPAALQMVVPNQMRAQVSAVWMLFLNLVTATAGPSAVGFYSSFVFADDMAVGKAIALANCIAVPLAAGALAYGIRAFRQAAP